MAQLPAVPVEFLACLTLDPDGSVPCTEPHVGELIAIVFDFDFDLSQFDATGQVDLEVLVFQLEQTFGAPCRAAVNAAVGAERDDIAVQADYPRDRARAEADTAGYGAVRAGRYAITGQPRTGSVVGVGTGPL